MPNESGPSTPPTSATVKNNPPASPRRSLGTLGASIRIRIATVIIDPRAIPCRIKPKNMTGPGVPCNMRLAKRVATNRAAITSKRCSGIASRGTTSAPTIPTMAGIEAQYPAATASSPRLIRISGSQLFKAWLIKKIPIAIANIRRTVRSLTRSAKAARLNFLPPVSVSAFMSPIVDNKSHISPPKNVKPEKTSITPRQFPSTRPIRTLLVRDSAISPPM